MNFMLLENTAVSFPLVNRRTFLWQIAPEISERPCDVDPRDKEGLPSANT